MPCRDNYDDYPTPYYADTVQELRKQVSFAESALCQTLVAFKSVIGEPMEFIDFQAAGITRMELEMWWAEHRRKDEEAKRLKEEEAAKDELLKKLKGSFSEEEIKLLSKISFLKS